MRLWGSVSKGLRSNSLPTLMNVMMLGARGVGKTSILASMNEQLKPTLNAVYLQLTADYESATDARLGEAVAKLKELPNDVKVSIEGNQDFREYIFGLGRIGSKRDMNLQFTDCPGGALAADAPAAQRERIRELVSTCQVVIIAIDAPALMEPVTRDREGHVIKAGGRWNPKVNRPSQITELFKNFYQNLEDNHLILLVPVKCESYVNDPPSALFLRRTIKESYADLLAYLRTMAHHVAVVITPVQTVGSVIFWSIRVENDWPIFNFQPIGPNAVYSPRDNEQPLRYLLRFVVREYHRGKMSGLGAILYFLLGKYQYLLEAAQALAVGCKDQSHPSQAFEIIQGDDLL